MTLQRVAFVVGLCAVVSACSRQRAAAPAEKTEPAGAELERLLLSVATCRFDASGIDAACGEHRKLQHALQGGRDQGPRLGLRHLGHPSPVVRVAATGLLRPVFRSQPEALAAVARAAQADRDPSVRAALINAVGTRAKEPPVSGLLLRTADDPDEGVRVESVGWLSSRWGKNAPGAAEKVIEKMIKDPSLKVRRAACGYAGRMSAADKVLPVLEKLTARPEDPQLYASCMHALVELWNPRRGTDPPSPAAYALSVARLRRTPRSQDQPPWEVIADFGRTPRGAPTWYRPQEVVKVLAEIAVDEKAHAVARSGAALALGELKAVARLQQIRTALGARPDSDSEGVIRAVDEGLAKAR
jgi:hypothetical protein